MTKIVNVRLSEEEYDVLKKISEDEVRTMSGLIRMILNRYVKEYNAEDKE